MAQGNQAPPPRSFPEPVQVHEIVGTLLKQADAGSKPLAARYNATHDGNYGYALYLLDHANRYEALNYTYYALGHLASYVPAAVFANVSWTVRHENLTGNASVSYVLNRTDPGAQANQARYADLVARVGEAQGNATSENLPYLLFAAHELATAGNELDQYNTYRSGLVQRGGWNDTLAQGAISYGLGPGILLDVAQGALNVSATLSSGTPVDAARYPALVARLGEDQVNYTSRSGLLWFQKSFTQYNDSGNAIFLAGLYAEENGTTAFNYVNNNIYKSTLDVPTLERVLNQSARKLGSELANASAEGIQHPYPATIVNAAYLLIGTYEQGNGSNAQAYSQVIPAMYGHVVAAKSLVDAYAFLTGNTAVEHHASKASSPVPGFTAGLALVVLAGASIVLVRRRR